MLEVVLLLSAAFIVGASKGGLASAGAIAVPMLALVMSPIAAAALLLPVFIVTDWFGVWLYRKDFSKRNVLILVPSMLLGIAIATLITPYTPESALLIFTGAIGLWYCAKTWLGSSQTERQPARLVPGVFWGVITGIASFITHSGSPPSQAYLLPQQLPKLTFAGTVAIAFAAGNFVKIPAYFAIGQLDNLNWSLVAGLSVAGIAGVYVGRWLTEIMRQETYMRFIHTTLFLLSVILVGRGGYELFAG
ncbi:sulfite exporter TauE/SafE family protein [Halioxenophilus aromaticivorans]|uniref:Probable membrane transporter protein n=1 Tax=Halioxenophilus aromaticivorans TaxID=1306992 RepID=A0AAV3U420_9ALTE